MNFTRRGSWSRRAVLGAGLGFAGLGTTGGCGFLTTEPEGEGSDSENSKKGKEAPALAERVRAGKLPAVAERLPDSPLVVEPTERVGVYGGTWRTALLGAADIPWLFRTVGYESLMRWTPDWKDLIPNVAESVEESEDGASFTVTLRKGTKWSDGEPVTADDMVFAYEDVQNDTDINPVFPSHFGIRGKPLTIKKVDDLTATLTFDEPNGLFLQRLALADQGAQLVMAPRHYLEKFHRKYNPNVDSLLEEAGFDHWADLFLSRSDPWENAELPRLHAWVPENDLGQGNRLVLRRNPYYWKVDSEGSQLPYLDEVVFDLLSDEEVMLLNATNGEIEFHTRHFNTLPNKPVLAQNRESGDYDFVTLQNTLMNEMVIALNLAHKDPVKRETFQNRDFRVGLSHAINREELIKVVFQQQGEPWQAAPIEDSEFYDEELAKQYTEYDPDLANQHLDRAGFSEKDDSGFRLGPDGKRIIINVEVALPALTPFWPDAMEFITDNWKQVGIDARVKTEDRSIFYERKEANEHDANVWSGDGGFGDEILEPRWYLPSSLESNYAIPWASWYMSNGTDGEEPPDLTRQQIELYYQLSTTPDEEERGKIFTEILELSKEAFYAIGTVFVSETYGIVKNNFKNVPEVIPESARFNTPAPTNPEQYFITEESED